MRTSVKGIGPFEDVAFDLAQLTVFVGVSGSGKGLLARTVKALYSAKTPEEAFMTIYDHLEPPKEGYAELDGRVLSSTRLSGEPFGRAIYLSERRFVIPLHFVIRKYAEKVKEELEAEEFERPLNVLAEMVETTVGDEYKKLLLLSLRPTDYEASELMDKLNTKAIEMVEEMFGDWNCTGALSAYLIFAALEGDYDLVAIDEPEAHLNPGRAVRVVREIVRKAKDKKVVATAELAHAVRAFQKFSEEEGVNAKIYTVADGRVSLIWEN